MIATTNLHRHPYDAWRWAEELFSRRDYLGAATALEGLLEHPEASEADLPQVRELLARSYYHSARLGRAATAAREALETDASNGYLHLLLGRTLERSGDDTAAATHLRLAEVMGESA